MSLMVVAGARSPGTTASALALAAVWPGRALFADCDPQGGTVAARLGVAPVPGLTTLATEGRHSCPSHLVDRHLQRLPQGFDALLSPPAPEQASSALATLGSSLPTALSQLERPVIADCGRAEAGSPANDLIAAAAMVFLVVRPTVEGVAHARARLAAMGEAVLVIVGDRPYRPSEVGGYLARPVAAVIAEDPKGAEALLAGKADPRSPLLRSVRILADRAAQRVLAGAGHD